MRDTSVTSVQRCAVPIGDVNINAGGTLSGLNTFSFRGATFTNNGGVSVVRFQCESNGAQSLAGTGTWTGGTITIGRSAEHTSALQSLTNLVCRLLLADKI